MQVRETVDPKIIYELVSVLYSFLKFGRGKKKGYLEELGELMIWERDDMLSQAVMGFLVTISSITNYSEAADGLRK